MKTTRSLLINAFLMLVCKTDLKLRTLCVGRKIIFSVVSERNTVSNEKLSKWCCVTLGWRKMLVMLENPESISSFMSLRMNPFQDFCYPCRCDSS